MFDWIKALHLIFVVGWFSGLLYLPRLFAYHAEIQDSTTSAHFSLMERRLSIGMSIAALGAIVFGIWLLVMLGGGWIAHNAWIHAKLALVVLLLGFHGWCQMQVKRFRTGATTGSPRYYRTLAQVPVVLLILIIWLALTQPF